MILWRCFSISNFNIRNIGTFNIKCVLLFFCSSFCYPLKKKKKQKPDPRHPGIAMVTVSLRTASNLSKYRAKGHKGKLFGWGKLCCMFHLTHVLLTLSNSEGTSRYHQWSPVHYNQVLLAILCPPSTPRWFLRGLSTSLPWGFTAQAFSAAFYSPV